MTNPLKKNLIVVCGPTASGKTRLGVRIVAQYNGEIISADSRQVYRGMDIGTGKDLAEYAVDGRSIPYHLIDIADPQEVYTVYNYQKDFFRVFDEITGRNKLPVVVGGTGLYIEAILRNYAIPVVPEDPALRAELMTREKQVLEDELQRTAPDLFQSTDRSSKKRIVRSLEIATYRHVYKGEIERRDPEYLRPVVLAVAWERPLLKERIRVRLKERFESGMIDEVRRLVDSGLSSERLAMFGMEYKHIAGFLRGEKDFETMFSELLHSIEQLSKRQSTWFRGMERRGVTMSWVNEANEEEAFKVLRGFEFKA